MKWIFLFLCGLMASFSWAQDKDGEKKAIEISGRIFANFSYDSTENPSDSGTPDSLRNKRGFDVDRSFLQASYKYDEAWASVLLLDMTRKSKTTAGQNIEYSLIYLRNAYVQHTGQVWDRPSRFRFGMQPAIYPPAIAESSLKTRFLFRTMADEIFGSHGFPSNATGVSYAVSPHDKIEVIGFVNNGYEGITAYGTNDNALAGDLLINIKMHESEEGAIKKAGLGLFNGYFQRSDSTSNFEEIRSEAVSLYAILENWVVYLDMINSKKDSAADPARGYGAVVAGNFGSHGVAARYYTGNDNFKTLTATAPKRYKNYLSTAYLYRILPGKINTGFVIDSKTSDNPLIFADHRSYWWRWEFLF